MATRFPCIHVADDVGREHQVLYMGPADGASCLAIGEGATLNDAKDDLIRQLSVDVAALLHEKGAIGRTPVPDIEAREGQIHAEAQLIRETDPSKRRALIDVRVTCVDQVALDRELERRRSRP